MKRFVFFILVISFSALIWSCSEETQAPTSGMEAEESMLIDQDDFLAKGGHGDHHSPVEFEVTLENLTPATGAGSSQPFSPPVLVTHKSQLHLFKVRRYASDELRQIAEDAVSGPMVEKLSNSDKVFDVVQGMETDVVFPESMATFRIKAKRGYDKFSLVSMLVNTNDAFTGIAGARLPHYGEKAYYLYAYDAGTEKNTELTAHIPGPCCGNPLVRVPTHKRIKYHRGIRGNGDLDPEIYGWHKKVAKLTIRRVHSEDPE
jgi:hypothetical protein